MTGNLLIIVMNLYLEVVHKRRLQSRGVFD